MPTIVVLLAECPWTTVSPSILVAISLALLSVSCVIWKTIELGRRARLAFDMAETLQEALKPGKQVDIARSVKILSSIDLEGYLVDDKTQQLIDSSLYILQLQFPAPASPKNL
jgi:hypothetical protein